MIRRVLLRVEAGGGCCGDDHPPTQEAAKTPGPLPPSAPGRPALCCFWAELQSQEFLTSGLGWQLVRQPAPSTSLGSPGLPARASML